MSSLYDVVIVGAGLAGLSAASALRDRNVLVLEREARPGGRVQTWSSHGVRCDLGAVFAFDPARSPVPLEQPPPIRESERIGLNVSGVTHWGGSVHACLAGLGLDAAEREALDAFESGRRDAEALPPRLAKALGAFFRVIHPGAIEEALPERQRDALQRFAVARHAGGNGQLVEALAASLGERLRLGATVIGIEEKYGLVEVRVLAGQQSEVIAARAVICATTGPVAAQLMPSMTNDRCRAFLERSRWGGGTVMAIGLRGADLPDFGYLVTPDRRFDTLLLHRGRGGQPDVLYVYYVGTPPPSPTLEETLAELRELKLGAFRPEQVVFSESRRWPEVGPLISPDSHGRFDEWETRPSERVFLAGDYTFVQPGQVLPYGMDQALASGSAAAAKAAAYLDVPDAIERYRSEYLVESTVYHLSGERPRVLQTKREGNLAYWGVVLLAEPDPELARYLLLGRRESCWEYQTGFGITSDDTVLACEGLLAAKVPRETLLPSLQRLVELFYEPGEGAFAALSPERQRVKACAQGRADYWCRPSLDATAQAAWLLRELAPERYRDVITACGRFVARAQHADGSFSGLWFPTVVATTWHALRLLAALGTEHASNVRRGLEFIRAGQGHDGSWRESVIETSAAVLALHHLGERAGTSADAQAIAAARRWLHANRQPGGGWAGEPLLYYWFEIGPGEKLLFHCRDRGRITSAWATRALRASEGARHGTID